MIRLPNNSQDLVLDDIIEGVSADQHGDVKINLMSLMCIISDLNYCMGKLEAHEYFLDQQNQEVGVESE